MDQLLCPEIVGRDAELRAVVGTVRAAARGAGESTVLVGEAGAGKSRLLAEARARARELDVTVLHGRVSAGRTSPFGPFGEAVASAFRGGLPADPVLHPVRVQLGWLAGEEMASRPGDGGIEPPAAQVLAEAMLRLLHVAARDGGALLLVEDLHWADADTLVVLDYLLANAADHGASCLLTLRPDPRCAAFRRMHRLADVRAARLVELRPLPADDVDRMVRLCLGTEAVPAGMLDFVRERADGVPFFVEELLAGLLRSGALVRADGGWQVVERRLRTVVPPTVADSVTARFADLHPRTQRVLQAAALLGRRIEWELLPRVTGLDPEAVLASLRESNYAQFLTAEPGDDGMRFRHALTRDHIAGLLIGPERLTLARRALDVVVAEHPQLPGHWCGLAAELAEMAGDRQRAAQLLLELGGRDRDRGALATAAARLERAIDLLRAAGAGTLPAREEMTVVRALAGDVDAALDLGERALEERRARGDAPARVADLELALGRALLVAGRYAQARKRALAARPGMAADVLLAQVDVAAGDPEAARATAGAVLDVAGLPPALACEAWEVLGQAARLHDVGAAERAFSAALDVATRHDLAAWRARALHELGTIDLLDTMRTDRLAEAQRAAVEAGSPATLALVDFHLAEALVARGRTADGREAALRSIAVARRLGSAILAPALLTVARSYAHELDVDAMEDALTRARAAAPGDPAIVAGEWGRVRAMLELHRADPAAALAALDRAVAVLRTLPGHHFPQWGLWALLHAVTGGDPATAAEAAAAPGSGTRFNRSLLRVAHAVRLGRWSSAHAESAFADGLVDLSGYVDVEWLIHTTGWLVAPVAHRDGWGDPIGWLQAAVRWFAEHHSPRLATGCRTALRDLGGQVPRRGRGTSPVPAQLLARGVSGREVDVLRLVGRRLSNRGIAEALVLSPRTVEKHVASLLRKTGSADRTELAVLAADLELTRGR